LDPEELKDSIRILYEAIAKGDINSLLSLFEEEAKMIWGGFVFKGKERIGEWAKELRRMFVELRYIETRLETKESLADHIFTIAVTTEEGRSGMLRCRAIYEFNNDKIHELHISVLDGILVLDQEDLRILGF
jgi:hypothetical protein